MSYEPKAFYSPAEVADILPVSVSYINSRIEKGEIDAVRLSPRVTRIPYGVVRALAGDPFIPLPSLRLRRNGGRSGRRCSRKMCRPRIAIS